MVKTQGKKKLIVTVIALAVVLLVIVGIYVRAASMTESETSKEMTGSSDTSVDTTATKPEKTDEEKLTTDVAAVDPETLTSIAVEPLGVTVFYSKGTPGFDFQVNKAADGTQYADFTSNDLVGTKCTDDQGIFASIVKNPTAGGEDAFISEKVKIGENTYALTLSGAGCTNNTDLLNQYQAGFKAGFGNLSAL